MKRGYYPVGGGEVEVRVTPTIPAATFSLIERGQVNRVMCFVFGEGPSHSERSRELCTQLKARLDGFFKELATECEEVAILFTYIPESEKRVQMHKMQTKRTIRKLQIKSTILSLFCKLSRK